MAVRLSLHR